MQDPGQVQRGSGEGSEASGEGQGGFVAEPGQVQQGSGEGSGAQVRFNRVPEKVPEKVWEALVQTQVRFNRVPEKVPEKVCEALVQSKVRFKQGSGEGSGECSGEGSRKPCCKAKSGSTGFRRRFRRRFQGSLGAKPSQVRRAPEKVPALGFAARFRKICQNKIKQTLRLLGIPPKLSIFDTLKPSSVI